MLWLVGSECSLVIVVPSRLYRHVCCTNETATPIKAILLMYIFQQSCFHNNQPMLHGWCGRCCLVNLQSNKPVLQSQKLHYPIHTDSNKALAKNKHALCLPYTSFFKEMLRPDHANMCSQLLCFMMKCCHMKNVSDLYLEY